MTTLPHHVSIPLPAPRFEEPQAHDNYVLATRVVHRAETLLHAAQGFPVALALIEAAIAAALDIDAASSWAEVRGARDYLDVAQDELERSGYRFC
jgi:hypothetical protein